VESLLDQVANVDVLIVDDNSQDGTIAIANSLASKHDRVAVLHRPEKLGLGPAYLEGFSHAFKNGFEVVVEMDADGSHRVEDLPAILSATKEADLVIGSRWTPGGKVENWPKSRQLLSKFGNRYARVLLGTRIKDMTSAFLKELVSRPVSSQGYSFQVELAYRASLQGVVKEVPITFVERAEGESKMTLRIVLEALVKIQLWGIRRIFS
jgi:dolichol-phosphate mannosyltransferase